MLDGLDAIAWGALRHAYGEASNVPGLLRALLSDDPDVREEAIADLFGTIWHQGTVYPASAAAVPFLAELLTAPETPDKVAVAVLLASIACGVGALEVHAVGDYSESAWRRIFARQGKSLEVEMRREAAEIDSVRQAVSAVLPQLLPFLQDDDPVVRQAVAEALARYPEHAAVTRPALEVASASESNQEARTTMHESLARLEPRPDTPPASTGRAGPGPPPA